MKVTVVGAGNVGATCADVYNAFGQAFFPHGIRKESRIGYSIGIDLCHT